VYGECLTGEEMWVVLKYADGGNFYNLLHDHSRELSWDVRLQFAHHAAMAVNFLHTCSPPILHRDIKSPNFLLVGKYGVFPYFFIFFILHFVIFIYIFI
jgi:serine/threonine protein kinase